MTNTLIKKRFLVGFSFKVIVTCSYLYSYKYSGFKFQLCRADSTEGLQNFHFLKCSFTLILQHRKRSYVYMRLFTVTAYKEAKCT